MATYSIGSPPVDAEKLADLQSIFNQLPDNTSKLISPKDVRSAVYSLWETISFKSTSIPTSEVNYIGIDQDNVTQKVYIGKKKNQGAYVLNDDLLTSDVDTFFYNTTDGSDTKVAFLAGTGSNWGYGTLLSPYIESKIVSLGSNDVTNFEIVNNSYVVDETGTFSGGNVNVYSNYGYVSLNGVNFPKLLNNSSGLNGRYLKYQWISGTPYAIWEDAFTASPTSLYSEGEVTITGSPVKINGFDMMFTDSNPIPATIGGIQEGETFDNIAVTEMIRRLLYPYIAPTVTTSMNYSLVEDGDAITIGSLSLGYTITRSATSSINSISLDPANYSGSIVAAGSILQGGTVTDSILPIIDDNLVIGSTWKSFTFTMSVTDDFTTVATSSSVKLVTPWFYGTATASFTTTTIGSSINDLLSTTSVSGKLAPILSQPVTSTSSLEFNKKLYITTDGLLNNQGYIYFGYPSSFPDIVEIYDQNSFPMSLIDDFTKYTISGIQSPNYYWQDKSYKFYISNSATTVPAGSQYSFNFVTASVV